MKESGRLLDSRRGESRFLDAGDFAWVELHEGEALSAEILERRADEVELLVVDDQESIVERFAVADGELRILGVEGTLGTDPTKVQAGSPFPRPKFLRLAKEMGAKFSFGTNNFAPAPKDLSRWLEAITWLDLKGSDIWTPSCLKHPPQ